MGKRTAAKPKSRALPQPAEPGHYLKKWRIKRGLTQEALADSAGLSTSSISQLESGEQWFSKDSLTALARALGRTEGDLLSRDPDAPETEMQAIVARLPADARRHALRMLRSLIEDDAA